MNPLELAITLLVTFLAGCIGTLLTLAAIIRNADEVRRWLRSALTVQHNEPQRPATEINGAPLVEEQSLPAPIPIR